MSRLDQVIRAADANGMVVDVSLFYYKQVGRLTDSAAIQTGINNVVDWLDAGGYTNVLLETANECNIGGFSPPVDCASQPTTIANIQSRSGGKLKVSVSYTGGTIPDASVVAQEDFIELHGNSMSASGVAGMVATVKGMAAYQANPKPIIFNEDSTSVANLDATAQAGASWGYYDQGSNNYVDGYQSPPTNWGINTAPKQAFFAEVANLTGAVASTSTPDPPTATVAPTGTPVSSASATATPSGQYVRDFTLINTTTQAAVPGDDPIPAGATINLAVTGSSLNIRANTVPAIVVSVVFGYDSNASYHTENTAPYDIPSDTNGVYNPFTPTLGAHTVTATAYSASNGGGTKGGAVSVGFTVVNATPTPVPSSTPTPAASATPIPATDTPISAPTATIAPTVTLAPSATATPTVVAPTATVTATSVPTATPSGTPALTVTPTPVTFPFSVILNCTYDSSRATPVACVVQ